MGAGWSADHEARAFRVDPDSLNPELDHWLRYTNYSPGADDWTRALADKPITVFEGSAKLAGAAGSRSSRAEGAALPVIAVRTGVLLARAIANTGDICLVY